jgi:PEP-CTERM motif
MVRRCITICLAIASLALFSATRAKADDLFTYEVGPDTYSWVLPASPTPDGYELGSIFTILDVTYSIDGTSYTGGQANFYPSGIPGGGFVLEQDGGSVLLNVFGSQLYMGPENAPTFDLGTFSLNNGSQDGPLDTLTIQTAPGTAATPEPSSLLLLAGGLFSFLGLAWKRRIAAQSIS